MFSAWGGVAGGKEGRLRQMESEREKWLRAGEDVSAAKAPHAIKSYSKLTDELSTTTGSGLPPDRPLPMGIVLFSVK
jgi:hypothetical protein